MTQIAVIFDMDGVISDTQKIHSHVESLLLERHGIAMSPEEITHRYSGVSAAPMFREIFENAGIPLPDLEALVAEKYQLLLQAATGNISPIPHVGSLIHSLYDAGIPLGVASASRLDFIELVLDSLGFRNYFQSITSGREVAQGKPAPDIFLLAAERLGCMPERCVVIEDANNGVRAAKAAKMRCVGYRGDPPSKQDFSIADITVESFADLAPDMIRQLYY